MNIYSDRPNEIINVWGKHSGDIVIRNQNKSEFSMIPHFFYEFNNDPTVEIINAGMVAKNEITFLSMDTNDLKEYLIEITTDKTKLLFDNLYEGNFTPMVNKIYESIKNTSIRPEQIYYFSCALDSDKHHDIYCHTHDIIRKINIYSCNAWEYHAYITSTIKDIKYRIENKEKTFLCFNRVLRTHRLALLGLILENNLLENTYYSFFDDIVYGKFSDIINTVKNNLSEETYRIIEDQYYLNKSQFPLKLNIEGHENQTSIKKEDLILFQKSYFSLVTETYFFTTTYPGDIDEQTIFFSEKIFKPIIMKHPFVLVSRPHSLEYLKKLGYRTFSPFIDESYDNIDNDEERLLAIVREVSRMNNFTSDEWIKWQTNIKPIIEHNYNIISSRKYYEYVFTRKNYEN